MKITNIRVVQKSRHLERPMRNAFESTSKRRFTFVLVETDANLTGIGDAFGDPLILPAIIEKRLAPLVIGRDPTDIAELWKAMFTQRPFWETAGSVVCGMSAIEVACWDIRGKSEGVLVCELLGGRKRDRVQAYASDLHCDEPELMAETVASYVEQGFQYVKTHIGGALEYERDLARLEAMRNAVGPEIGLMIDINTAFDRSTALKRGRDFESFNSFWYEEPLSPIDFRGHAELREKLRMKIATGENLYMVEGFEPLFDCQGCDFVMPDILRCGGIEQTRRICQNASQHDVIVSPHNFSSGVGLAATLHLMAALSEIQLLEFDSTGTAIYEEMFLDPLVVEDGEVGVPTKGGLGIVLVED